MKPTQYELATLAAAMPLIGKPRDRVKAALELWDAAGWELSFMAECEEAQSERENEVAALLEEIDFPTGPVTLSEFLALVIPHSKTADRLAKFREYLRTSPVEFWRGEDDLPQLRQHGFIAGTAPEFAAPFLRWLANDRATKRKARATTAGKARAEKKSLAAKKAAKSAPRKR